MFHPADFTIRSDGVCRLNPEMARQIIMITAAKEDQQAKASLRYKIL